MAGLISLCANINPFPLAPPSPSLLHGRSAPLEGVLAKSAGGWNYHTLCPFLLSNAASFLEGISPNRRYLARFWTYVFERDFAFEGVTVIMLSRMVKQPAILRLEVYVRERVPCIYGPPTGLCLRNLFVSFSFSFVSSHGATLPPRPPSQHFSLFIYLCGNCDSDVSVRQEPSDTRYSKLAWRYRWR